MRWKGHVVSPLDITARRREEWHTWPRKVEWHGATWGLNRPGVVTSRATANYYLPPLTGGPGTWISDPFGSDRHPIQFTTPWSNRIRSDVKLSHYCIIDCSICTVVSLCAIWSMKCINMNIGVSRIAFCLRLEMNLHPIITRSYEQKKKRVKYSDSTFSKHVLLEILSKKRWFVY